MVAAPRLSRRTASVAERLHRHDDVGRRDGVGVEHRARLGVLLVGEQGVPARVGLDRHVVARARSACRPAPAPSRRASRPHGSPGPRRSSRGGPYRPQAAGQGKGVQRHMPRPAARPLAEVATGRASAPSPATADPRRSRGAGPSCSRRAGYLVRATVRCGRNRAPSTSMPARLAAARQPVASRSSSVRPGSSRSRPAQSTFARPAFGNAPPPEIAVSNAVRRAAARPSRSTRSSSLRSRHVRRGRRASRAPGRPGPSGTRPRRGVRRGTRRGARAPPAAGPARRRAASSIRLDVAAERGPDRVGDRHREQPAEHVAHDGPARGPVAEPRAPPAGERQREGHRDDGDPDPQRSGRTA